MSFNLTRRLFFSKLSFLLVVIVVSLSGSAFQCGFGGNSGNGSGSQEGRGFRVWVRTEPCSGRFDWLSVSKEHTGGGKNFYIPYESVIANDGCTRSDSSGCTFAEANALMEKLRSNPKFFSYCCRDYSVWENVMTGKKSVVVGKFGTAGQDFRFVKGDLCCEEAEELSGVKGACSGTQAGSGYHTEENIDRPGGDYQDFDLSTPNIELCRQACDGDPNCKAFSYVKPNIQGTSARCWLKNIVPQPMTSTCCISGVKETPTIAVRRTPKTPGGDTTNDNSGGTNDNSNYPITPNPTPTSTVPTVSNRWELVSTTVTPATPSNGYSYNAQSTTVNLLVYNGDKHNFQWTKPPQSFDANGFTVTLNVQCQSQPNNVCASILGVSGDGMDSDTPGRERMAQANGTNGSMGRGDKSITFKPTTNSNEIVVSVGMMWGAVNFQYKYRRV